MSLTALNDATEENPAGTEAWIVESHRTSGVSYWAGYFFTTNVEEAVQFRRQKDGEKLINEQFSHQKAYFCVQHKWQ